MLQNFYEKFFIEYLRWLVLAMTRLNFSAIRFTYLAAILTFDKFSKTSHKSFIDALFTRFSVTFVIKINHMHQKVKPNFYLNIIFNNLSL